MKQELGFMCAPEPRPHVGQVKPRGQRTGFHFVHLQKKKKKKKKKKRKKKKQQ